jgi:hypothetical protein
MSQETSAGRDTILLAGGVIHSALKRFGDGDAGSDERLAICSATLILGSGFSRTVRCASAGSRPRSAGEKTRFRGLGRVGFAFTFAAAAYNLVRLPTLLADTV